MSGRCCFSCTAEPVWAFADTVAQLSEMACFQVVYDGHQPEYPGDFTSVEQTVDEVISYLKIPRRLTLDGAYGCSMGGACLTRMLALGKYPSAEPSSMADHALSAALLSAKSCCWRGMCCLSKWRQTAERYWKRLFRRDGLPPQGTTPKRSTMPWKPISRPSPIGRFAIYSGPPTTMRFEVPCESWHKDHLLVRRRRKEGSQAGYPVHQALFS